MSLNLLFYHPSRVLKHVKPFPARQSCLAISAERVLLLEDVHLCLHPLCMKRQTLQQPLCWGPGQTNALASAAQLAASNELASSAFCLAGGISTLSLQPISGKQNLSTVGFRFTFYC